MDATKTEGGVVQATVRKNAWVQRSKCAHFRSMSWCHLSVPFVLLFVYSRIRENKKDIASIGDVDATFPSSFVTAYFPSSLAVPISLPFHLVIFLSRSSLPLSRTFQREAATPPPPLLPLVQNKSPAVVISHLRSFQTVSVPSTVSRLSSLFPSRFFRAGEVGSPENVSSRAPPTHPTQTPRGREIDVT